MSQPPSTFSDLLNRSTKAFTYLALVKKDGSPQVTPVWFDYDGTHFVVNTARGRVKDKILSHHPRIAMCIQDPGNPYRYLQVRGKVVDESEDGAYDVICDLNDKYHGNRNYPKRPGEVRVTFRILGEYYKGMG